LATYQTLQRRHPNRPVNHIVLAVGLVCASFVGVSRVMSGQHFLTDVTAGALVGSGMGILIPALHRSSVTVQAQGLGLGLTAPLP
jgi:membrane-associated phospholipid phosphatase